jgi:hypothetical protein
MASSLFDFNALKPKETEIILLTIRGYSMLGTSLPEAFKILAEIEKDKKFLRVYRLITYQIHKKGEDPSDAMINLKIVNAFEAFILKNSLSTRDAVDNILYIRNNGSLYEKKLVTMFIGPAIWFFTTLLSLPSLSTKILSTEQELIKTLKLQQGIDITGQLQLPVWVGIPMLDIAIYSSFALFVSSIILYIYYDKTNPFKLYTIFRGKAYSDIAIFLNILNILKQTGKDTKLVINTLIKSNNFKRELKLLVLLSNTRNMSDIFKKFNYPIDILYFINMGEKNKMLWTTMEEIISFSKNSSDVSLEKMDFYWKKPLLFAAMGFAIYIALKLMLLAFTAVTLYLDSAG